MIFNLDILDNTYSPLNPSNITIDTEVLALTDAITDTMAVTLEAGNTYDLIFPAETGGLTPLSTVTVSFPEEPALDYTTVAGELNAGVTDSISPTVDITTINFSVLSQAGETYGETFRITGDNIQITLTDGTSTWNFTGVNTLSQVIPDNSSVDITVVSSGLITYTNTVAVYTNEVDASVLMQPLITDNTHIDYRRVYPHFFTIIEPCTYTVHIYDGQASDWGTIVYDENDVDFSSGVRNTVFSPCGPAALDLKQTIFVYTVSPCGTMQVLLFDPVLSWTHPVVTVTEYMPELTLNRAFDCCETIDEAITVWPVSMELREGTIHDHCGVATLATTVLSYVVTAPNGTEVLNTTYTGLVVDAGPLSSLVGTFTPDQLGTYTMTVSITNCCETVSTEYLFDTCGSWVITNSTCNVITIDNLSSLNEITYTIKKLTDYDTFENVTDQVGVIIPTGGDVTIDLVDDNLYTVTITDSHPSTVDDERIFLLDCNIKKCKKEFLLKILCDDFANCDKVARITLLSEFAEFKALEEIVYQKWDEWKQQQSIVDSYSINDIMEDVTTVSKAMSSIAKVCGECETLNDDDCGCS